MRMKYIFMTCLVLCALTGSPAKAELSAFNDATRFFDATDTEAEVIAAGAAFVSSGGRRIYIGTDQASATNQNPVVASFSNGVLDWAVDDYETGVADGRGAGLLWDEGGRLYAAFTSNGPDGIATGLVAHSAAGWLQAYGSGGGPTVSFILQIDPVNGAPIRGTYVIARLSNGNSNALLPTGMFFVGNRVVLEASSFFSPLRTNKERMVQDAAASGPFPYRIMFDETLGEALIAEAPGWDGVEAFSNLELVVKDGFENN
jgi:hypothetical protein